MRGHAAISAGAALVALAVVTSCSGQDPSASTTSSTGLSASQEVAMAFLDAYGDFDATRATTYLTDGAILATWKDPESLRLELALLRASGAEQTVTGCEPLGDRPEGTGVSCAYDYHGIRSDELGLGPYSDNDWALVIRDGKIVSARQNIAYMTNGFSEQVWEPFAEWVAATYPGDVQKMYNSPAQTNYRLSEESIGLWEERSREYVELNSPSPPTGTTTG